MKMFDDEVQALEWMVGVLDKRGDGDCMDNERFAFLDDENGMMAYKEASTRGCCGFFDRHVMVNGRAAIIGCNYGH
jgi:hypothetical protein